MTRIEYVPNRRNFFLSLYCHSSKQGVIHSFSFSPISILKFRLFFTVLNSKNLFCLVLFARSSWGESTHARGFGVGRLAFCTNHTPSYSETNHETLMSSPLDCISLGNSRPSVSLAKSFPSHPFPYQTSTIKNGAQQQASQS